MKRIISLIIIILCFIFSSCGRIDYDKNSATSSPSSLITTPNTEIKGTTPIGSESKDSTASPSKDGQDEEVKLTMTQVSVINKDSFSDESRYTNYLSLSNKKYIIPGLEQNTVPQGLAVSPVDKRIYISSYSNKSNSPSVILVLDNMGRFVAEYIIKNKNGTPFTGHVGGIAVTEKYLYFSAESTDGKYKIAEFELASLKQYGSSEIRVEKTVAVPISPSYLFYADGIMWVGNFYLKGSYPLGNIFDFTTYVDGYAYGGYVGGFVLDKNEARMHEDSSLGYAKPDYVITTPDKVQGFAYKDGKIALSISYGRKNDSYIQIHTVNLLSFSKTVEADGVSYKFESLRKSNLIKKITALPMTEGLALTEEGSLLILFESAAKKYSDSRCPTDYIWEMNF